MDYLKKLIWEEVGPNTYRNRLTDVVYDFGAMMKSYENDMLQMHSNRSTICVVRDHYDPYYDVEPITIYRKTSRDGFIKFDISNPWTLDNITYGACNSLDDIHNGLVHLHKNAIECTLDNPVANELFNVLVIKKFMDCLNTYDKVSHGYKTMFWYEKCVPILTDSLNPFNLLTLVENNIGPEAKEYLYNNSTGFIGKNGPTMLVSWINPPTEKEDSIPIKTFKRREEDIRLDFHKYMLKRAFTYSKHGTCDRRQVGAVIVINDEMVGIGFNDALPGKPRCTEEGHMMVENSCKRTVHAEVNAILSTIESIGDFKDAVLYCTDEPCSDCLKFMSAQGGIKEVYYARPYPKKYDVDTDIELYHINFEW